jgi:hypothetical protein
MKPRAILIAVAGGVICLAALLFSHHVSQVEAESLQLGGSQPVAAPCCAGVGLREVDFPYYDLRDGSQSTLNLVSDSPQPIELSIVIYSSLGRTAIAPPFTIQPQQKLAIDMGSLLGKMGLDAAGEFGEGSVAVMFTGTIMPVVGQVYIFRMRRPEIKARRIRSRCGSDVVRRLRSPDRRQPKIGGRHATNAATYCA